MRWWLFLFILLLPAAYAAESWHYAGETWKEGEDVYSVEGTDHTRVLFSVNGRSFFLELGECTAQGLDEYCYLKSAYPADEKHTKYAAGRQYYGYYMGIRTLSPKVTVTRTTSTIAPKLGEEIDVLVTIKNTGDYAATYVAYNETIPQGMEITNGPRVFNTVTYTAKTLGAGEELKFRYAVTPVDYVNAQLIPNVSFLYEGKPFTTKVPGVSFLIETPLVVNRSIPANVNLGDSTTYSINITNKGDEEMAGNITVRLPAAWREMKLEGFTPGSNNSYVATFTIKPGSSQNLKIIARSNSAGAYKIPVNLAATVHGTTFTRYYEEATTVKADKLVPTIKLSGTRSVYAPGEALTISGILENVGGVTFEGISGSLHAPGLFTDIPFSHAQFPGKKTLTEAETIAVMPQVENTTVFDITLAGRYMTPTGGIYDFEAQRQITVSPISTAVALTRTVEPSLPKAGTNVTITLHGKNAQGKYVTFSAYDTADLDSVSGLMFIETSLERDAEKDLYIYQLAIPQDYAKPSFNITTTLKVKDQEVPIKLVTTVPINGRVQAQEVVKNDTKQEAVAAEETPKEKLGFFASIWDFLKNLF